MLKEKNFTLKQLFSIADGRLSTNMDDVCEMLNHITGESLFTHQLPVVHKYITEIKPSWFITVSNEIDNIKYNIGNNFEDLMNQIDNYYFNVSYSIPELTDEHKNDCISYMCKNNLLYKIGKNNKLNKG